MSNITMEKVELPFAMAEEIKNLRTGISFSGENIKTVAFTSCVPNEGKSTIALETAKSFAELGKKAVYIDCDLRKSILKCKITEGKIQEGLTHYLTGQCDLQDIIYASQVEKDGLGFWIIPSGPMSNSPTELISSPKFADMIQKLRDDFDIVIIDTPPLGSVVDASIIGALVDGNIMVVEAGGANYQLAQKVKGKLDAAGARILGVVLNKVDKSEKSYGYYKYGKSYGYHYGYGE